MDDLPKALINYDHFNILNSVQPITAIIIEFLEKEILQIQTL